MKTLTTLCCAALALCGAIYAQTPGDHMTVRFNQSVMVGETRLPAGNCDIQVVRGSSDSIVLVLRSQAGPYTAALVSRVSEDNSDMEGSASVVLNRHGSDLQLYRVLFGAGIGYQLNNAE